MLCTFHQIILYIHKEYIQLELINFIDHFTESPKLVDLLQWYQWKKGTQGIDRLLYVNYRQNGSWNTITLVFTFEVFLFKLW